MKAAKRKAAEHSYAQVSLWLHGAVHFTCCRERNDCTDLVWENTPVVVRAVGQSAMREGEG